MRKLTEAQRSVLTCLAKACYRTPADIGWSLPLKPGKRIMKAQGAGRVGASMAVALIKLGYVQSVAHLRNGHPAYAITDAGRAALSETREA